MARTGPIKVDALNLSVVKNLAADHARLVKATGGLPPEIVAKALRYACAPTSGTLTAAELDALRAATFEVTE